MTKNAPSEQTEENRKKGRSGMIGVLALGLVAMAASLGATFMLTPSPSPASESCNSDVQPTDSAASASQAEQSYVQLPELLVTIGSEPATRYLKMNVAVVTTKDGIEAVEDSQLALIDAFTTYLRAVELSDFEDPAFYGHLRDQLLRRAELVLGASVADGILITEFLLR